jgi:hypothetical protein
VSTNVSRNSPNTLILPAVSIYLRHYPGTDTDGAIPNATFVLKAGGASASGRTDANGLVPVLIPVGQTVTMQVFGSEFGLSVRPSIEDVATLEGAKRRLHMLGYRPGTVDATVNQESDQALLKFQTDQALANPHPFGFDNTRAVDVNTRTKLTNAAGA